VAYERKVKSVSEFLFEGRPVQLDNFARKTTSVQALGKNKKVL
jgi:hypothetical protein